MILNAHAYDHSQVERARARLYRVGVRDLSFGCSKFKFVNMLYMYIHRKIWSDIRCVSFLFASFFLIHVLNIGL